MSRRGNFIGIKGRFSVEYDIARLSVTAADPLRGIGTMIKGQGDYGKPSRITTGACLTPRSGRIYRQPISCASLDLRRGKFPKINRSVPNLDFSRCFGIIDFPEYKGELWLRLLVSGIT